MHILTRTAIESYLSCARQFQLRYIARSGWPSRPFSQMERERMAIGSIFHQMVAQHIRFPSGREHDSVPPEPIEQWWQNFMDHAPILSGGRVMVEKTIRFQLTEKLQLLGRVDCLHLTENKIAIYDWKTGRPRRPADLKRDWQTRLYLALIFAARHELGMATLTPDRVSMTYWYAQTPQKSVEITYDAAWHAENWAGIEEIAAQIEVDLNRGEEPWPLTEEHKRCLHCPFHAICGRVGGAGNDINDIKGRGLDLDDDLDEARDAVEALRSAPDLSPLEFDL